MHPVVKDKQADAAEPPKDERHDTMTNHARMPKSTQKRYQNAVPHPYSPEPKWGKRSLIPPSSATSYSSPAARHFATNRSG